MDTEIDLKSLWNKKQVPERNSGELMKELRKVKRRKILRILMLCILLISTVVFLLFIKKAYQPEFITTEVGYILIVSAILIILLLYAGILKFKSRQNPNEDSKRFLQSLENIYQHEFYIAGNIILLYFILLTTGVCLVIYEYILPMKLSMRFIIYTLTIGWLAFNWFYIKPRVIKKRQKEFHQINEKISALKKQLE